MKARVRRNRGRKRVDRFRETGSARRGARLSVRSRRRADGHCQRAPQGVEGDVRRFPAARSQRTGEGPCRSTSTPTTCEFVDGKTRDDGVRSFLASRGIELPEGDHDDDAGTETVHGLGNREECQLFRRRCTTTASRCSKDRADTSRPSTKAGLAVAVVSSSAPTPARCSTSPDSTRFVEQRVDGVTHARASTSHGKPAPDSYLRAARLLGVEAGAGGRVRGCARRGGRPDGPGISVSWSASTGSGRPKRLRRPRRRHRRRRSRRAAGDLMITEDRLSRSSRGAFAKPGCNSDLIAQTESLFALSNGHIGMRGNLDEGEPHGLPRHLPQLVLRDTAPAVCRGGLRLSRGGPDGHRRHQRQGDAAAGRRRAVRRPLRRTAASTSACWTFAPAP